MNRPFLLAALAAAMNMSAEVKITKIEPADWFAGMNSPVLQLMVYGEGVRSAESVDTDYPGVTVDSIARLDSPNYLFVYLNLQGAEPGVIDLRFTFPSSHITVRYPLKRRAMAAVGHKGFTNADVLYMLMPDRFAMAGGGDDKAAKERLAYLSPYTVDRSRPSLRHGGNLEGIRRHLDYFNELGVTALWLTPVLENNSPDSGGFSTYHGYATTDYYRVDPRFGTNDEYKRLVEECHAKGLKVVMDMIFNHCGIDHPWIKDLPSRDWLNHAQWLNRDASSRSPAPPAYLQTSYKLTPVLDPYASRVDLAETVDGWFVPSMPDLNQRNPHLMTYLTQSSIWWIETVGIDGIRMDTYPYADRRAMASWMRRLDEEYPNFNTVGETWVTEPAYTAAWQKGSRLQKENSYLKTVMDFSFYDKLVKAKQEETDGWWNGYNRIYNSFVYDYLYEDPSHVMAFIDNHDTDRFLAPWLNDSLKMRLEGIPLLKQALALLLTVRRVPQLYYGTEILMNGTKAVTDGDVRKDFPGGFPGDSRDCFTAGGRSPLEQDMFRWLSRLLHWRKNNRTVIEGSQTQFIPYNGVYVIARRSKSSTVMTILNGTSRRAKMPLKRYNEVIGSATEAKNILTRRRVSLSGDTLSLPPRAVLVLEF